MKFLRDFRDFDSYRSVGVQNCNNVVFVGGRD